jgi:hypothetical protein
VFDSGKEKKECKREKNDDEIYILMWERGERKQEREKMCYQARETIEEWM